MHSLNSHTDIGLSHFSVEDNVNSRTTVNVWLTILARQETVLCKSNVEWCRRMTMSYIHGLYSHIDIGLGMNVCRNTPVRESSGKKTEESQASQNRQAEGKHCVHTGEGCVHSCRGDIRCWISLFNWKEMDVDDIIYIDGTLFWPKPLLVVGDVGCPPPTPCPLSPTCIVGDMEWPPPQSTSPSCLVGNTECPFPLRVPY